MYNILIFSNVEIILKLIFTFINQILVNFDKLCIFALYMLITVRNVIS